VRAVRETEGLPPHAQGELVQRRLAEWSSEAATAVQHLLEERHSDLLLTSLFGASIAHTAAAPSSTPWGVVNSTFYVGPKPPRPLEVDFASRAVPLVRYLVTHLNHAAVVLHATDARFDYDHTALPPRHQYVGPLLWEQPAPIPSYLGEPGDPWVLITLSSQTQDDVQIAQSALQILADYPVRVVLTMGQGHRAEELDSIPPNAQVERYVPHAKILEQSSLFISHAGHGSVMKALWHGVPMVLIPWGRDQPGGAARAARLGTAMVVERDQVEGPSLPQAIDAARSVPRREAARHVAQRLQSVDSVATACACIERLGLDTG
jgi:UDP:flavonoid glycosyltransferase YjiC (YdhE family)